MTVTIPAAGWQIFTDVSPEWLFLRLARCETEADSSPPIAESAWNLAAENGVKRLVVEIDDGTLLSSYLIGQLVLLHKRVVLNGGVLRLCGVSQQNYSIIELMRLSDRLPNYKNREAAVNGFRS